MSEQQSGFGLDREAPVPHAQTRPTAKGESFERVTRILSSIAITLIPVVIAIVGWLIQHSLTIMSVKQKYVEIALSILTIEGETNPVLREWAINLLSDNSPTPFSANLKQKLITGEETLPIQKSLSVQLTAIPSIGPAPLNNVTLVAAIGGTARGPIIYSFDCTNDGFWEQTVTATTNETIYVARDLCDYPNPGSYSAKVRVSRDNLSFEGISGILVEAAP